MLCPFFVVSFAKGLEQDSSKVVVDYGGCVIAGAPVLGLTLLLALAQCRRQVLVLLSARVVRTGIGSGSNHLSARMSMTDWATSKPSVYLTCTNAAPRCIAGGTGCKFCDKLHFFASQAVLFCYMNL